MRDFKVLTGPITLSRSSPALVVAHVTRLVKMVEAVDRNAPHAPDHKDFNDPSPEEDAPRSEARAPAPHSYKSDPKVASPSKIHPGSVCNQVTIELMPLATARPAVTVD